jgi:hypothetical protein
MFISNACYYHDNPIPPLVDILFDFPSYAGYHPVPAKSGYLAFGAIGLVIATIIGRSQKEGNGASSVN